MKLSIIFTCLISFLSTIVNAQQIVTNGSSTSSVISQYGNTFSNAGGSVLHDKVNGKNNNVKMKESVMTIMINFSVCHFLRQLDFSSISTRAKYIFGFR